MLTIFSKGGGKMEETEFEGGRKMNAHDNSAADYTSKNISIKIEEFLRSTDTNLLHLLPGASIQDLQFMEDILLLMIKNIQTRKSMEIRFNERTLFTNSQDSCDSPDRDSYSPAGVSPQESVSDNSTINPPHEDSEIEFDAPVQNIPPKNKVIPEKSNMEKNASRVEKKVQLSAPMVQEKDDRIKFYQITDLPKNYLPMIASSGPEVLINNHHYMIPAVLDNLGLFVYGACATCTQADCNSCQKIKNPKNGIRAEMKMILLSNQEVQVVGFNKIVADGFRIPLPDLISMVKQNKDRTVSQLLAVFMGHLFLVDKLFKGKPTEEKEVTNQFMPIAMEALMEYHKKLQI
jgi:hypothetical protein